MTKIITGKDILNAFRYIYERINVGAGCPDVAVWYIKDLVKNACDDAFKQKNKKSKLKAKLNHTFKPIFSEDSFFYPDIEIGYANSLMIKGLSKIIKDESLTDEHKEILSYFIIQPKPCHVSNAEFYWIVEKIWNGDKDYSSSNVYSVKNEVNIIVDDLVEIGYLSSKDKNIFVIKHSPI